LGLKFQLEPKLAATLICAVVKPLAAAGICVPLTTPGAPRVVAVFQKTLFAMVPVFSAAIPP
jgi:hypothetical protein